MKDEGLQKIYSNPIYLEYLRRHPKWYYYLDLDSKYLNDFLRVVQKESKTTTYDKLESLRTKVNFVSSFIKYMTKE